MFPTKRKRKIKKKVVSTAAVISINTKDFRKQSSYCIRHYRLHNITKRGCLLKTLSVWSRLLNMYQTSMSRQRHQQQQTSYTGTLFRSLTLIFILIQSTDTESKMRTIHILLQQVLGKDFLYSTQVLVVEEKPPTPLWEWIPQSYIFILHFYTKKKRNKTHKL